MTEQNLRLDGRTKRALDVAIARKQVSQESYRAVLAGEITLQRAKDDRYLDDTRGRLRPKPFNHSEGLARNYSEGPAPGRVQLGDLPRPPARPVRGQAGLRALGQGGRLHPRPPVLRPQTGCGGWPPAPQPRLCRQGAGELVHGQAGDAPLSPAQTRALPNTARTMDDR